MVTSENQSALASAAAWLVNLTQGSFGTTIAILSIAWLGFALLRGQLALRRGAYIVIGCFILFGAPTIANGLLLLVRSAVPTVTPTPPPQMAPPPMVLPSPPPPNPDPYAGASVPM